MKANCNWKQTHLCGSAYSEHCEYLLFTSRATEYNGKKLDDYCVYCTFQNKARKINGTATWTGLTPKFCPKRQKIEAQKENETMAKKFAFDTNMISDVKSVNANSFMDNFKMIDFTSIDFNPNNDYSLDMIDELAEDIQREGLKQNLVVIPTDNNRYLLLSGHRRLTALKRLYEAGKISSKLVPCLIDTVQKSDTENELNLVMLNHTSRKYTDADVFNEHKRLQRIFRQLDMEGKKIEGRTRDNIAKALNVSPAQIGKIENIKNNAIPEVISAVENGELSISTANEIAKCSEAEQNEIINSTETEQIKSADVKKKRESAAANKSKKSDKSSDDNSEKNVLPVAQESEQKVATSEITLTQKEVEYLRKNISSFYSLLHFCNEDDEPTVVSIIEKIKGEEQ